MSVIIAVNISKIPFLLFFFMVNWGSQGSEGWQFQHLVFIPVVFFIFLPLSFAEKAALRSRGVVTVLTYIPVFVALINLIPIFLGVTTSTFAYAHLLGILLSIFEIVLYFKPTIGKSV